MNAAKAYRLSVHEPDGTVLWLIGEWYGGQRWARLNEPETIQFNVTGDFEGVDDLAFPNEIWLRQGTSSTVLQKFVILAVTEGQAGHRWIQVEAQSLLGQLGRERGCSYATSGATAVSTIVSDLLTGYQAYGYPITVGTIESAYGTPTIELTLEEASLLDALNRIRAAVGGYFWVDTSRALHWKAVPGSDDDRWIRVGHNARQIRRRTDATNIITRLVGYGYGVTPDTRLTSTQDDAAAQAIYGVVKGAFHAPGIRDQDTLDLVTTERLARVSTPQVSHHVEAINLADAQSVLYYNFQAGLMAAGNIVRMICDAPALDISAMIRSVTWNLDNPMDVEIALVNPEVEDAEYPAVEGDDITRMVEAVRTIGALSRDTGVLESVRAAIASGLADLANLMWMDAANPYEGTLAQAIADLFGVPDDDDATVDAMRDAVWDALDTDLNSGNYGTLVGDLKAALEVPSAGSGDPEPVDCTTPDTGSSPDFAPADHVHIGTEHYQATTRAGLATTGVSDGAIGYPTSEKIGCQRADGSWARLQYSPEEVETLPAIPTVAMQEVLWVSTGSGTGDDQVWRAAPGQSRWSPTQKYTTLSGAPPP